MIRRDVTGTAVRDVLQSLLRHRRKSAWLLAIVLTVTVLITFFSPREYRSAAKLFVRLGRENATLDPTATLGQNSIVALPYSRENEINSVVEILQSRSLIEKLVDALGPAAVLNAGADPAVSDPSTSASETPGWTERIMGGCKGLLGGGLDERQQAISALTKKLRIDTPRKSNVIDISYDGLTPRQCQAVVSKLIDLYLDEHIRLNRAHGSHQFFSDQTGRLRGELARREAELRDLKNKTGLAAPDMQRKMIVARMGRLEDDLLQAEQSQAVAQVRVHALRQEMDGMPATQVTAETSGLGNEGTDRMRDQFYALQVREKEAAAKYTEDHPKMRQIRDQIGAASAVLNAEQRGRKQVTTEPNRLRHQAELSLLGEGPALAALQKKTESLRTQLAGVRKELATLNENEIRVASLQREVDLLEADYRKYSNNLEQARIDQQLEIQRMSNISIVQPASYEPRPIRPRTALNLLLGLFTGLFGALALPLVLDRFGGGPTIAERFEWHSQAPILGRVPRVPVDEMTVECRRTPR
jgi:polysaccharide biosynthesis protein PslE